LPVIERLAHSSSAWRIHRALRRLLRRSVRATSPR
jgi:hypothetical protein